MDRGFFVTFEGIEQCGKSVQIERLFSNLGEEGYNPCILREPGGTYISEQIREVLLNPENKGMSQLTELFLYEAARAQVVEEKIMPALKDGRIVLCDRFYDSTTAYQGYGRGIRIDIINYLNGIVCQGVCPDLTFIFDISLELSFARLKVKGKDIDRLESENREFFERVRRGFLDLAELNKQRVVVINGDDPIKENEEKVWQVFCERYQEFKGGKNVFTNKS